MNNTNPTPTIGATMARMTIRSQPSAVLEAAQEFESTMQQEGVTLSDLLKGVAQQQERRLKQA